MMRPAVLIACLSILAVLSILGCGDSGKQPATPSSATQGTSATPAAQPATTDPAPAAPVASTNTSPATTPAQTTATPPTTTTPIAPVSVPGQRSDDTTVGKVMSFATKVKPLDVGATVPNVTLKGTDGKDVELTKLIAGKPTVLVFYRGGWCLFCKRQLAGLAQAHPRLQELGYQLIAIGLDTPQNAASTAAENGLDYTLLSDSKADATKAFGLAYQVDDDTLKRYAGFGIDLEAASGEKHHILPVPAVYVVGSDGTIKFRHYDPDYSKRLDAAKLVEQAQIALYRK